MHRQAGEVGGSRLIGGASLVQLLAAAAGAAEAAQQKAEGVAETVRQAAAAVSEKVGEVVQVSAPQVDWLLFASDSAAKRPLKERMPTKLLHHLTSSSLLLSFLP